MPRITITATGLPSADAALDRRSGPKLDRTIGRASIAALRAIRPAMKAAAPVLTGRTRRAVRVARATGEARPGAYIGIGRSVVYRGALVKRRPFVVQTAAAHRGTMMAVFRETIEREVNR